MSIPKVSVIIPVYNTERYLRDAVESIVNQTLKDIEILIVNDGSTDGSQNIIDELSKKDSRILAFNQKNSGQSVARNVGLKYAKGEYIYFMDSDDLLERQALELCYDYCVSRQVDFVFFDGDIMYEDAQSPLSWDYHRTKKYNEQDLYSGISLLNDMLDNWTFRAVPWLYLIERNFLQNINLVFFPGIIHEDELFSVLLFLQAQRIGCLKKNLVQHRVRGNSTMTKRYSMRNVDCYLTVVDELFRYGKHQASIQSVVEKYASYTLNAVFRTAFVLPLFDKLKIFWKCRRAGYLRFLNKKYLGIYIENSLNDRL